MQQSATLGLPSTLKRVTVTASHGISSSNETIALHIDGVHLHATAKMLGFDIDFRRLLQEFQRRGRLLRAFYYSTIAGDEQYSSLRPLIDWLDFNGYTVLTKPARESTGADVGGGKYRGTMDVDLAVNMMENVRHVDHVVLFSGDGNFRRLVEAIQRRGVRVTVVSTIATQSSIIADELRRQADVFVDLLELRSKIERASKKV